MDQSVGEAPGLSPLTHSEIRSVIGGIIVAMFLAALDQTIVGTALPTIGTELGDVEQMPWVVTAYLVASTAVTPLYGKLSDIHGRRVMLLVGIVIFVIGSIACALAPTMLILILSRALQGLGGGGLIALAQTIIADVVAPRERGRYQVHIASVFVISSLLGPVLGGFFAEYLHWSAIFWINLPLGALAFSMTSSALRRLPHHHRRHSLDLLGALLMTSGTVSLLLALSWGGVRFAWTSGPVLGLLSGCVAFWWLFALRLRRAQEPFIPLSVLRDQVVRTGMLAACFGMGTFIGLTIYLPVYLENVVGLSAAASGLALIPLMIGTVIGATLSGRSMARFRHYKRVPALGLLLAIAASALLSGYAGTLSLLSTEILLASVSLGIGTLFPVSTVAIQNAVAAHQLGTATGVANFFRQLGGALIVAVFGVILFAGQDLPSAGFPGQADGAQLLKAFKGVFLAASLGLALALAFLIRMEERPLRGSVT